jgi:hypothetical protein
VHFYCAFIAFSTAIFEYGIPYNLKRIDMLFKQSADERQLGFCLSKGLSAAVAGQAARRFTEGFSTPSSINEARALRIHRLSVTSVPKDCTAVLVRVAITLAGEVWLNA